MQTYSPRTEARHAGEHSLSRQSTTTSGFVDLRPHAIAQRKLQAMTSQSPQVQRWARFPIGNRVGVHAGWAAPSGAVIQRYLNIQGGGLFDLTNETAFRERYSEDAIKEMETDIRAEGGRKRFPNIEAALASPDVVMIGIRDGHYYVEFIEQPRKPVEGGWQRYVGGHASYARRPREGFEDLHLSGLINCVAIAVQTYDGEGVSEIALAHFATPSGIDPGSKKITPQGGLVLHGFRFLSPGVASLRWSEDSATDGDGYVSGESAAQIVASALLRYGIETVSIESVAGGNARYRLDHEGNAGWV